MAHFFVRCMNRMLEREREREVEMKGITNIWHFVHFSTARVVNTLFSYIVPCTPFHHNFILWQKKVGRSSCRKSVLDDDGKCLIVRRSVRLKAIGSFVCIYLKCPTRVYIWYVSIYCITCEMERKTFLDPDKNRNVEVGTKSLIILQPVENVHCVVAKSFACSNSLNLCDGLCVRLSMCQFLHVVCHVALPHK